MKKLLLYLLLTAAISYAPAAATAADRFAPDIQKIIDRGKLIVAVYHEDSEPFFMHDESGRFYGFDIDMARDIAKKLGVEVEFNRKAQTYNEVVDIVVRKEADIAISYLSKTLDRSRKVLFTEPYISLNLAVLINRLKAAQEKKGDDIKDILQSNGNEIGVLRESSHVDYVKELFPKAKIREYVIFDPDIIDAVLKGEIIAGFFDELDIRRAIHRRPELSLNLKTVVIKDIEDPIAIAVPSGSVQLLSWLNLYLSTHVQDLDADKLLKRYPEVFGVKE